MRELKVTFLPAYSGSYFQLLAYPHRVTTAGGTTAGGAAWLILHIFTPGALPDATRICVSSRDQTRDILLVR